MYDYTIKQRAQNNRLYMELWTSYRHTCIYYTTATYIGHQQLQVYSGEALQK